MSTTPAVQQPLMAYPSTLELYGPEIEHYNQLQRKFRKACSQVILLNNRIQDAQTRYDRAVGQRRKSFRYVGRLHLVTLEGVRNMIYEYASRAADELDALQDKLVFLGLMEDAAEEMEPAEQ
jgi:hypothetical protein